MSYENPYTPPTLTGFNSSPPSDDGQRTASNVVRWATHLTKIGNPLKTYAQAINSAVLSAFNLLPSRLNPRTAAEIAAGVTPTNYQYEPGDVRRYGAVSGADCTAAIQRAIDTGHGVIFRGNGAVYHCVGLTQSTDGQTFHFYDGAELRKNGNGVVLTCTGHDLEFVSMHVEGVSATYTGAGVSLGGNRNTLVNCSVRDTDGTALVSTGSRTQVLGTQNVFWSANGTYDIEIGTSGSLTTYHHLTNIYTSSANGGIRFIDCGGQSVVGSQFGKLVIDSGTSPAGVNGGTYANNRILGNVTIEISSALFVANQFGAVTITIATGVSGTSIDASNSFQGGAPSVTNNGNADNYWAYITTIGVVHNLGHTIPNTTAFIVQGTVAGTDLTVSMSGANNATINNEASAAGIILNQTGAGTINMDVNSARSMQIDASTTATHTRFLVYDVDAGALVRVTVGANDSGGAGFAVLRVPNN